MDVKLRTVKWVIGEKFRGFVAMLFWLRVKPLIVNWDVEKGSRETVWKLHSYVHNYITKECEQFFLLVSVLTFFFVQTSFDAFPD